MKKNHVTWMSAFIFGSAILCFFSFLQNMALDFPLTWKTYIVPFFFGGCIGLLVAMRHYRVKEVKEDLQKAHNDLEIMVSRRTKELHRLNNELKLELSEHKKTERTLRESEEKYRNILNNIDDGYFEVDITGNFTFINNAMCRILGYHKEELVGMNNRQYMDKENAKKIYEAFNKVYKSGIPTKALDWKLIRKDGLECFVETVVSLIKDTDGKKIGFRAIARDVTDRKALEQQLRQAQKMESIGTLAGGIAHNFNNVLMGIQGHASLILMDKKSTDSDFEHIKGIKEYVQNAAELTKDLLGFARGGKYETKPLNLNELIKHENRMFGRTKKEVTIQGKYEPSLWTVEADHGQIRQALLNLYVNAWQAMPNGGNIYVRTQNIALDESDVKPHDVTAGHYVNISVTDTGIGMDDSVKEKIFDPFFTTQEMRSGTGLGLSSVYGIIKNHGGFINVYSEKEKGTTFNIYLPASEKDVPDEKKQHKKIVKGEGTLLLVDDEEMIIDVGKQLLEKLGYTVLTADSGEEALAVYEKNKNDIHLVILDMIMPAMSGGETYDRLKAVNPSIKVLLASGYSMNDQSQEILNRGCDGFIQKPFSLKELSHKIKNTMEKK